MAQSSIGDPDRVPDTEEVALGTPASGRSTDGSSGTLIPWPVQRCGGEPRRYTGAPACAASEPTGAVARLSVATPPPADRARYKDAILQRLDFMTVFSGIRNQKPSGDGWIQGLCPFHDDHHPSFSFRPKTGAWKCFATCGGGDVFSYLMRQSGSSFNDVLYDLGDKLGLERPTAPTRDTRDVIYQYRDEHGTLLYEVLRQPGKKFKQRRPDGKGGWIWNLEGVRRVLYRLPEVLHRLYETVYIVEGEKDADRVAGLGLLGTTNSSGAGAWCSEFSEVLSGRDVVILPDNDEKGRKRAVDVARLLVGMATSVKIVNLPDLPKKGDISDWLNAGHDVAELNALVASTKPEHADDDPMVKNVRPVIIINNRQSIEVINDVWTATHAANDPPELFLSLGHLVRLSPAVERPIIQPLDEHSAFGHLMRVASWQRSGRNGLVDTDPKKFYAQDILANPDPGLPELESIITSPVFDRDWRLISEPGYHPDSKLYYYALPGAAPYDIPLYPTAEEVAAALSLFLDDLLVDFPFASESDRTHAVAAILLPFARQMFSGTTPVHLIEAPAPGSGKTLLMNLISTIAMGYCPGCTTLTTNEEENRKKLTALLGQGPSVIAIDNLTALHSAQVAAVITADVWKDRVLGKTQVLSCANRALWLVSGNNLELSAEIARRCLPICIDTRVQQPTCRTGFKHKSVLNWTLKNHHQLVHSALILIRHWIACGGPLSNKTRGSFDDWCSHIGGMLELFGLTGFLENCAERETAADLESGEWNAFVVAWKDHFGFVPVSASQLLALAESRGLISFAIAGSNLHSQRIKLGKALYNIRGRRFSDVIVQSEDDKHTKVRVYRLVEAVQC